LQTGVLYFPEKFFQKFCKISIIFGLCGFEGLRKGTSELYAYTANLKESGKESFDTVLKAAVAKAVKNAEQRSAGAWSFMEEVRL
jgi:DNA integrity scanning protein DisA with diadenylate cyclase activity